MIMGSDSDLAVMRGAIDALAEFDVACEVHVVFANRTPHVLDNFERSALEALRKNPDQRLVETSWSLLSDSVRLVAPVMMGPACVSCHNSHPESQRRDWKVGDVRGIQEISITQPIAANLFSFKFLLAYFALAGISWLVTRWRVTDGAHRSDGIPRSRCQRRQCWCGRRGQAGDSDRPCRRGGAHPG